MIDAKQPITRAEAARMLEAYMNPARKLGAREGATDTDIEIVASVEAMIHEGRSVPEYLRAVAEAVESKIEQIRKMRERSQAYLEQWQQGGHVELRRYKEKYGSGVHLFRAYRDRRKADRQETAARRAELEAEMRRPRVGIEYTAEMAELAMLIILDELDPIIADVLKVCERGKMGPAEALAELRAALRIGKGMSHYHAGLKAQNRHAVYLWYQAYSDMEDSRAFRSERAIAKEIAKELGISQRSALNYWTQARSENPVFQRIANGALRKRSADPKPTATAKKTLKSLKDFGYGKGKRAKQ